MKIPKKFYYILILFLILIILLSGCRSYDLNNFIIPDDSEFMSLIWELNTPQKIGTYMYLNFTYKYHPKGVLTPYQLYIIKKGDCNDFSLFGTYIAYLNGYETCQIRIKYKDCKINHWLGIYKENNFYTYTSNRSYNTNKYNTLGQLVNSFCISYGKSLQKYEVFDYNMNFIEEN